MSAASRRDEPVDLVRDRRRVVAGGLVAELEGCGRVEDDRMRRVPRRAAEPSAGASSRSTSSHVWPSCRAIVRAISRALGASGSALFRTRAAGDSAATSISAAMFAAAVVWSMPAPRWARKTAGRPSSTRFTKTHSRGERDPGPWILDGLSTVTGTPLSSRTCSAATLFAP